jgi:ring-1,2-phenylacetyl-CoA epoxidase subunit PaaD
VVKQLDDSGEASPIEVKAWEALAAVHDPEIPPLSITDLGIVEAIRVTSRAVEVDLLPTFSGCPALDVIREDAEAAVTAIAGERSVMVRFVYSPPWTSDRISSDGRAALESHGITPPGGGARAGDRVIVPLASLHRSVHMVACPFCGSRETIMDSAFGPTLCRSTHFCRSCRNPFEAFKPKETGAAS